MANITYRVKVVRGDLQLEVDGDKKFVLEMLARFDKSSAMSSGKGSPPERPAKATKTDALAPAVGKGLDAWQMTITSELHKLAGNIGMARNFAGIHWRSDYDQSLLLGETVAISLLRDQYSTFNESFVGFTFTKFDRSIITV